jgi:hypothetical protein
MCRGFANPGTVDTPLTMCRSVRHISPRSARTEYPEHAIEHQAATKTGPPPAIDFSEDIGNHSSGLIREVLTLCHHGIPFRRWPRTRRIRAPKYAVCFAVLRTETSSADVQLSLGRLRVNQADGNASVHRIPQGLSRRAWVRSS